jgi:hypothetical protein
LPSKENKKIMNLFDLNIEQVLEHWRMEHALREIIANAIDEQIITKSKDIEIHSKYTNPGQQKICKKQKICPSRFISPMNVNRSCMCGNSPRSESRRVLQ